MLGNPLFIGRIRHRDKVHPGLHAAIVDADLWDAVQQRLATHRRRRTPTRASDEPSPLAGRLFDPEGRKMRPSHASKKGRRYRYYVSSMLAQGRRSEAERSRGSRNPRSRPWSSMHSGPQYPDDAALEDRALTQSRIERIVLWAGSIAIHPTSDPASPIEIAWSPPPPRGRREILASRGSEGHDRGIKAEARTVLLRSIALGRRWLDEVLD